MKAITDINEVHEVLLGIAKEFDRICRENGIRYWMLGGTQLGAVRHKGFIPWDDDMDFGVMQGDFQKLAVLLEKELPSIYRCRTRDNCQTQYGNTLKIEDTRTVINLKGSTYDENLFMGINIDVFPLVFTNNHKFMFSKNWCISTLLKIQFFRFSDYSRAGWLKASVSRFLQITLFWLKLNQITEFVNKYLIANKGDFIVNYWGRWIMKEIVYKDIMGNPQEYDFEGCSFFGVEQPHQYLTHLYGDYMSPPPKDKMNIHLSDVCWK